LPICRKTSYQGGEFVRDASFKDGTGAQRKFLAQDRNEKMGLRDAKIKGGVARFGHYEADFERHELRKSGVRISLQDQPFKLLRILLENQDKIVTREELRQNLWPGDIYVNFDPCLNTALNKLRHALREDPDRPVFIETIPREGYRFIAPVSWMESSASRELPSSFDGVSPTNGESHAVAEPQALSRHWPLERYGLRRVGAFAFLCGVAIAVTAILFHLPTPRTAAAKRDKIVVLVMPFDNLTTDQSQDYLSASFTEEMITQLGSKYARCLTVLSRPAAAQLKSSRTPLDRAARELGVDYVLAGSIRRSEDHVRIAAQLFHAPDQTSIWAGTYDVETSGDTIALESEVSTRIAESLALEIVPYAQWITPALTLTSTAKSFG
jgi:TolB-like protein/DNA-binding winged helix-turn-helix (wHTH) protein